MAVGIGSGLGRFGVSGPPNRSAPAGNNTVTGNPSRPWYATGPLWTMVFLVVGYILVFRTLR
jgi:hypothetical protein